MKRVLITGGTGLFGLNFFNQYKNKFKIFLFGNKKKIKNINVFYFNIFNKSKLTDFLKKNNIDTIIHAAAQTNIEKCQKNIKNCYKTNVELTQYLGRISKKEHIKFIFISTDQIFNKNLSFKSEKLKKNPCNFYGYTKSVAENFLLKDNPNCLIIRTNFFGYGNKSRLSFSDWILFNIKKKRKIYLFTDVYFNPLYLKYLNKYLIKLIKLNSKGIFNIVSDDKISKYNFGVMLSKIFNIDEKFIVKSEISKNFKLIKRPKDMTLSNKKLKNKIKCKKINLQNQIKTMLKDMK